jgi:hypothetical protein
MVACAGKPKQVVPPGPVLQLDQTTLNFTPVSAADPAGTVPSVTLTLLSQGQQPVKITNVSVSKDSNSSHDDSGLFVPNGPDVNPIPGGGEGVITVTFTGSGLGRFSAVLTFDSNDPANATVNVPMVIDRQSSTIALSSSQNLNVTATLTTPGTLSVNLVNEGDGTLTVSGPNGTTTGALSCIQTQGPDGNNGPNSCTVNGTGTEANAFSVSGPSPTSLPPSDPNAGNPPSAVITVSFQPSVVGTYKAHVGVTNNDPRLDGGQFYFDVTGVATQ